MMMRKTIITRVDDEDKQKLLKKADEENISISDIIRRYIREGLKNG